MSLELGRSSAAKDDDEEPTDSGEEAAAGGGASQPPPEDTKADGSPRRSVLAPFMAAGSAGDSQSDEASGDAAGDDENAEAARPQDANGTSATGEESATAHQARDGKAGAIADAGGTTVSSDPRNGDPGDTGASAATGAGTSPPGVRGRAVDAASSVPRLGSSAMGTGTSAAKAASTATGPRFTPAGPRSNATETPGSTTETPGSTTEPPGSAAGPWADPGGLGRASVDTDGPLLGDAEELRANWLRLQAGFVDDPHEAVSGAADLVEHTAQAFVGAMRLRQQKLREMWDAGRQQAGGGRGDTADDRQGAGPTAAAADSTEQLRLLMRRYRFLFNQICRL